MRALVKSSFEVTRVPNVQQRAAQAGLACEHPIFVIGSPRSGTTALAVALSQHPGLWAGQEGRFITRLFRGGRLNQALSMETVESPPGWLTAESVDRAEFFAYMGLGINALFTSRSGGKRWIDHAPRNTPMASQLAELFPGACFLHIVRDGRRVVHSLRNLPVVEKRWEFEAACSVWRDRVNQGANLVEALPDRALQIRNEDMKTEPAVTFRRILEFLDMPHDDAPAEFSAANCVNSSFPSTDLPEDVPWLGWSPHHQAMFVDIAGEAMKRFGYAMGASV